ncbi:MAG: DUF3800 domain-containing protein [Candidatus Pacebacteria bacterium]|nr:DUF3800 domain-containing protein [Candidatus Paceibacterota bacterium]MDD5013141.1 DUF3800 domain-containing protein [Candidatus Paceibacterota bacterium]MDD5752902.1 DUF3800 domain-containing protein [Candidatus Paceibacterota bacterium]
MINNSFLEDYKNIWSKFCFLDESGSLANPKEPFFTIGVIKCSQPYYLYSKLLYQRDKVNFHDEMKFNKISRKNIDFLKFAIESFLDARSVNFYSYTVDKQGSYFQKEFSLNPWIAYEQISARLIEVALGSNEILIVIADHITTPKNIRFEVEIKRKINEKQKRLAIGGICRFDSRGNDLIQIVDILIGAINYDLKISSGLIKKTDKNKKELVDFIKKNIGIVDFVGGFRNRIFNIFVDKDIKSRLPLDFSSSKKEKEPSS